MEIAPLALSPYRLWREAGFIRGAAQPIAGKELAGGVMSLEQLSSLSQIISAFAVVASLVFVGIQLHHATGAVRASTSQAHSANYYALNSCIIGDGEFARIWRESLADFDSQGPDAKVRFVALASSIFRFYESSRAQWLRGQLDPEHWQMVERQATSFASQPGIKSWWKLRRQWHSAEFRNWFEALPEADSRTLYGATSSSEPRPSPG